MEIAFMFAAVIVLAAVIAPILYLAFVWKQPEKHKKKKWKQCTHCKKWSETK